MKKKSIKNDIPEESMRNEYDFDYSKGIRGKYKRQISEEEGYIQLLPEVRKVFKSSESVNKALLAFINAYPAPEVGSYN
ncbi:MAG: hypothetical protein RO257_11570 [Candidatus Kapabacteria bacterium]|nr:hypothetical protein [Candidatus Kapabacteria bacterium]